VFCSSSVLFIFVKKFQVQNLQNKIAKQIKNLKTRKSEKEKGMDTEKNRGEEF
jgi:hypothetical protein